MFAQVRQPLCTGWSGEFGAACHDLLGPDLLGPLADDGRALRGGLWHDDCWSSLMVSERITHILSQAGLIGAATALVFMAMADHADAKPREAKALRGKAAVTSTDPGEQAQAWLGRAVWRAGACDRQENFQTFRFGDNPQVEVGSGRPGDGEALQVLRVGLSTDGLIEVETRVCAPVGCNQTVERYRRIGANQMQEWHFEGRLPDHVPYVLVRDGQAVDGSGPGRLFNRCPD